MNSFSVSGKVFATNLFWQTIGGGSRGAAAARAQARKLPIDIGVASNIVLRNTTPAQFGVSFTDSPNHRAGLFSAGAVIAEGIGGTWAGLFDVPNGWYLLACRRGFIDPDTDRLFPRADTDAARRALQDMMVDAKVKTIYAPAQFAIPGAKDYPVDRLLRRSARGLRGTLSRHRLSPLDARKALLQSLLKFAPYAAAAVAVLVLARPVATQIQQRLHPPPPPTALLRIPDPWENLAPAGSVLHQCVSAILAYPELPGARLKMAECRGGRLTFHYAPATPIALPLILEERAVPSCDLTSAEKGELQFACTLEQSGKIGRQAAAPRDSAARRLWEIFGPLGGGIEMSAPHQAPIPGSTGMPPVQITVKARGTAPPDTIADSLADLPTMAISAVDFSMPNLWYVEGTLYAR